MGFDSTILEALVLGIIGGAIGYKGKDVYNSMRGNGVAAGAVARADAGAIDEGPRTPWYSNYFKRRQEEAPALETPVLAEETPVLAEETPALASDEPAALEAVYEFDGHIHLVSDPVENQTSAFIRIFLSNNPEINPGDLMFEIITDSGLTYNIKRNGYTDLLDKTSPSEIPRVHITKTICKIFVQNSNKYRSYTFTITPDVCNPNVMSAFQNELKYNQYKLDNDSNTTIVWPNRQVTNWDNLKEAAGINIFKRTMEQGGRSRRRRRSSNRRQSRRR